MSNSFAEMVSTRTSVAETFRTSFAETFSTRTSVAETFSTRTSFAEMFLTSGIANSSAMDGSNCTAVSTTGHNATVSKSFFHRKGAVAGVFIAIGLILVALVLAAISISRHRRTKQYSDDTTGAAAIETQVPDTSVEVIKHVYSDMAIQVGDIPNGSPVRENDTRNELDAQESYNIAEHPVGICVQDAVPIEVLATEGVEVKYTIGVEHASAETQAVGLLETRQDMSCPPSPSPLVVSPSPSIASPPSLAPCPSSPMSCPSPPMASPHLPMSYPTSPVAHQSLLAACPTPPITSPPPLVSCPSPLVAYLSRPMSCSPLRSCRSSPMSSSVAYPPPSVACQSPSEACPPLSEACPSPPVACSSIPAVFDGAIGIDLGTTYSSVSVWRDDCVEIITDDYGNRSIPSYVAFSDEGLLVGDAARSQASVNPRNTIFGIKRLIGRRFNDPDVEKNIANWPFEVINRDGLPFIKVIHHGEEKIYSPQEISSMILTRLKGMAEAKLCKTVKKVVVSVPSHFNESQRRATIEACSLAGLEVLRTINEPTSTAVGYWLNCPTNNGKNVLVFDLGGGKLDVSLVNIMDGVFTVKATASHAHLGGEDFDDNLLKYFKEEFQRKTKRDVSEDACALKHLKSACEQAKKTLCSEAQATVDVGALYQEENITITVQITITRARFEEINATLFQSILEPIERVLQDVNMPCSQVDDIVIVGGSTRIPRIQSLVSEYFGGRKLNIFVNLDETVVCGAAVQAATLAGKRMVSASTPAVVIQEIQPLSLGVATAGDVFTIVVPRNTPIPTNRTRIFTTVCDNQPRVLFAVHEGEHPRCSQNRLLKEFRLTDIPPMPRRVPQLNTTFEIDADGLLTVTAEERTTHREAHVTITNSTVSRSMGLGT